MSFLTPKEVAERIGVSESHVKNMIRDGRLPGYKFNGTRYRIEETDFNQWLEEQKLPYADKQNNDNMEDLEQ